MPNFNTCIYNFTCGNGTLSVLDAGSNTTWSLSTHNPVTFSGFIYNTNLPYNAAATKASTCTAWRTASQTLYSNKSYMDGIFTNLQHHYLYLSNNLHDLRLGTWLSGGLQFCKVQWSIWSNHSTIIICLKDKPQRDIQKLQEHKEERCDTDTSLKTQRSTHIL